MAQQLVNEGQAHFERGEFDEAAWSADKALELDPANQNAVKLKRLSLEVKPKSLQ
jgi:Flp pilus assembly protein TadD